MAPKVIRDLLYLDFAKAASIWSQFDDGLLERTSTTDDVGKDRAAGAKVGIPGIAEANLGVDYLQKRSTLQSRTLHHDLLARVEARLVEAGLVTHLSEISNRESSAESIRSKIGDRPYVSAVGSSMLEDYRRMLGISERFNEIIEFLRRTAQATAKQNPQYVEMSRGLAELKAQLPSIGDRNLRAVAKDKIKKLDEQLEQATQPKISGIDDWLLQGVRSWISTFMATRINFRIYPFPECPSFQILCNLKRECFVDDDLEHLLYGYGTRPNVPLGVFGLITSMPLKDPTSDV